MRVNKTVLFSIITLTFFFFATHISASTIDPFTNFNLYSLGNIQGGSDFQGTTGSAGDVSLTGFSLLGLDSNNYVLHAS